MGWLSDRRAERDRRKAEAGKDAWWQEVKGFAQDRTDTSPVELLRSTDARIERLGELFAAADARAAGLTAEQRAKSEDPALLDSLLSADLSGPDAHLGEAVEIRRIGRGLFDEGGGLWMVAVAARTTELHPVTTSRITAAWKGIGDW